MAHFRIFSLYLRNFFLYFWKEVSLLLMSVEVKRKNNESAEGMIRRFTKKVQQSGVLYRAKQTRFHQSAKSKRAVRDDAKRRRMISERRDFLRKVGKLDEAEDYSNSQWSTMYRNRLAGGSKGPTKVTIKKK